MLQRSNNQNHKMTFSKLLLLVALLIFTTIFSNQIFAQENVTPSKEKEFKLEQDFKNAINFCPIAIAFGIYAVNFEHMLTPHSGMLVRFEYESIPKTYTAAKINASSYAYSINYRWHRMGKMNSDFYGAFARYRTGDGNGTLDDTPFDFTNTDYTFGANAGKRWILDCGLNATISLGYGYVIDDDERNPNTEAIKKIIDQFGEDYDFSGGFYGEVSIGYAF